MLAPDRRAGQLSGQTCWCSSRRKAAVRPSMEGRTIVRPDPDTSCPTAQLSADEAYAFNGGPDNCPARLARYPHVGDGDPPSMEGRTIVRPDTTGTRDNTGCYTPSMEGRTIVRPDRTRGPSMEGRTIVRPDLTSTLQWRAGQLSGQTCGCGGLRRRARTFNGGPDNCPARLWFGPSSGTGQTVQITFNGGPDNCPARPPNPHRTYRNSKWRAGQLSGQTRTVFSGRCWRESAFNGGPDNCPARHPCRLQQSSRRSPSMEGRTIVRPDLSHRGTPRPNQYHAFNGGPDNCPARQDRRSTRSYHQTTLQWRAGQLSGQTALAVRRQDS